MMLAPRDTFLSSCHSMSTHTPPGPGASSPSAMEVEFKQSALSLLNLPDEMIEHIASFFPSEVACTDGELGLTGGEQSTNAGSSKCALAEAHSAALLEGSPKLGCATAVEGTNDEYSMTTLCRASQRVSRYIEDIQGPKRLFEQLQRHGHYMQQFECDGIGTYRIVVVVVP